MHNLFVTSITFLNVHWFNFQDLVLVSRDLIWNISTNFLNINSFETLIMLQWCKSWESEHLKQIYLQPALYFYGWYRPTGVPIDISLSTAV